MSSEGKLFFTRQRQHQSGEEARDQAMKQIIGAVLHYMDRGYYIKTRDEPRTKWDGLPQSQSPMRTCTYINSLSRPAVLLFLFRLLQVCELSRCQRPLARCQLARQEADVSHNSEALRVCKLLLDVYPVYYWSSMVFKLLFNASKMSFQVTA